MQISLVSTLRSFSSKNGSAIRQESALFSWSLLKDTETIIVGADDQDGEAISQHYGFILERDVLRAYDIGYFSKAPIITDMLQRALAAAKGRWVALINSDIILQPEFPAELSTVLHLPEVADSKSCFLTVRRRDMPLQSAIKDEAALRALASQPFRMHPVTGSDIFIASKSFWHRILEEMPGFIYGRFSHDVFLHHYAVLHAAPAVDASESIRCYHPLHEHQVNRDDPEIFHNLQMYEALFGSEVFTLDDPRWVHI